MRAILLLTIAAMAICSLSAAQQVTTEEGKWIVVDAAWAAARADSIWLGDVTSYRFGNAVRTAAGLWVVPFVNYRYFSFPESVTILTLPGATDSIPAPVYRSILIGQ